MTEPVSLHRTLDQELLALFRGVSLECLVCGEFVLHEGASITCPECGMRLHGRAEANVTPVRFGSRAG